jgi:hypothetical protein
MPIQTQNPDTSIYKNIAGFNDYNAAAQAQGLQSALAAAQIQGQMQDRLLKQKQLEQGVDAPAAVREYQFYNQLPKAQQEQFLTVKRAAQIQNLGGGFGVYNPVQGGVTPIQGGEIMPNPAQQDEIDRKNREAEDMFNRGLDVKQKALEATQRLIGVYNPETKTYKGGNESGVRANRGGVSTLFPNVSDSAVDAAADLETLSNLLTTENLGLLKGVLSDTDMKVLASIGSGELQGSDEKALGAIRRMQQALSGKVAAGRAIQQQGFSGELPPNLSDPSLFIDDNEFDANIGTEVPVNTPQFNAPKVGTVKGGYAFMGGDPADPKNWKK